MTFSEYVALVDQEIPGIDAGLMNISPLEMIRVVASRLYLSKDYKSLLSQVTREQLVHYHRHGMTNFDVPPKAGPSTTTQTEKTRGGGSDFA